MTLPTDRAARLAETLRAYASDETEYVCTNGHDRCYSGSYTGSDCPYCDKGITTDGQMALDAVDELSRLERENETLRKERDELFEWKVEHGGYDDGD